jgi:hypothetical protein
VIADVDGVVVVPAERAAEVAAAARTRADNEEGKRKRSGAAELGLDVYSMRAPLEAAGLRYVDQAAGPIKNIDISCTPVPYLNRFQRNFSGGPVRRRVLEPNVLAPSGLLHRWPSEAL